VTAATKKTVLILCTGNSCRSQMAEAIWTDIAGGRWDAFSAGTAPAGAVHRLARTVLAEIGLAVPGARSKSIAEFAGRRFDLVVTVCDGAREACPAFPGATDQRHWPFADPARAAGDDDEKLAVFRRVRDEIAARIRDFVAAAAG